MTLEDYRKDYYEFSGKTSDVARTLSLSGIAVIWVFADHRSNGYQLPRELLLPAALIVAALSLDLLQYSCATAIWGVFSRHHEKRGVKPDGELTAPPWLNWPGLSCFWLKLTAVAVAYCLLLKYLLLRLF